MCFLLEKGGITLKKLNGFTFIEALVAMSIIIMLVATITPIQIILKQEKKQLQDKRKITLHLHDQLQTFIWNEKNLNNKENVEFIYGVSVKFQFMYENEYIKGCASWKNVRNKYEEICLYGLKQ